MNTALCWLFFTFLHVRAWQTLGKAKVMPTKMGCCTVIVVGAHRRFVCAPSSSSLPSSVGASFLMIFLLLLSYLIPGHLSSLVISSLSLSFLSFCLTEDGPFDWLDLATRSIWSTADCLCVCFITLHPLLKFHLRYLQTLLFCCSSIWFIYLATS